MTSSLDDRNADSLPSIRGSELELIEYTCDVWARGKYSSFARCFARIPPLFIGTSAGLCYS